jgi:type I restriction enzyme M protein
VLVPKTGPRNNEPLILPKLLCLLLRSDLVYGQIVHLVIGTGRPRLGKAALLNTRIPLPPLDRQRRLLQSYQQSAGAAQALLAESRKAAEAATRIVDAAGRQLVADLFEVGDRSRDMNRGG